MSTTRTSTNDLEGLAKQPLTMRFSKSVPDNTRTKKFQLALFKAHFGVRWKRCRGQVFVVTDGTSTDSDRIDGRWCPGNCNHHS